MHSMLLPNDTFELTVVYKLCKVFRAKSLCYTDTIHSITTACTHLNTKDYVIHLLHHFDLPALGGKLEVASHISSQIVLFTQF